VELACEQLGVRFGGSVALANVSLTFPSGTRALVLGWTGSGKTTLLKTLAGLVTPSEGRVLWEREPLGELGREDRARRLARLGMVFQTDALFDSLTTLGNVELPLVKRELPPEVAHTRAREALAEVGLSEAADRFPERLSGGMRKRAGLARAIVARPEVLLADDPLSGLDPGTGAQIAALIDRTSQGQTLIFAGVEPPSTLAFPRWIWLESGRVTYDGPPRPALLEERA
jgi:phospholipid/cholesterol/gamma-HCH transport system ATP-binding protein